MAQLDFPANPSPGQEYIAPNDVVYTWDEADQKWRVTGGSYVPMRGTGSYVMTGEIQLYADPVNQLGAVPKQYVDQKIWILIHHL